MKGKLRTAIKMGRVFVGPRAGQTAGLDADKKLICNWSSAEMARLR